MLSKNLITEIGFKKYIEDSINSEVFDSPIYESADEFGEWMEFESLKHLVACRVLVSIPYILMPQAYYEMEKEIESVSIAKCQDSLEECRKVLKQFPKKLATILTEQGRVDYSELYFTPRSIYRYFRDTMNIKLKPEDIRLDKKSGRIRVRYTE